MKIRCLDIALICNKVLNERSTGTQELIKFTIFCDPEQSCSMLFDFSIFVRFMYIFSFYNGLINISTNLYEV